MLEPVGGWSWSLRELVREVLSSVVEGRRLLGRPLRVEEVQPFERRFERGWTLLCLPCSETRGDIRIAMLITL